MLDDRKEDRADYRADVDRLRSDFKEFRIEDFKSLRKDVDGLKIKWAWVVGASAVCGVLATVVIDFIKTHIHMGG